MRRKVIYTCCVGGYDRLLQPLAVSPEFDYVCFADGYAEERVGVWQIRPLPFCDPCATVTSRYPKLLPHLVLPEYDYSVYMDANVQIVEADFYRAVEAKVASGCVVAQVKHSVPPIDCVYEEISYAFKYDKVSLADALRQARHLRRSGFPRHFGLFENNLIFRKHNDGRVVAMMNEWWEEFVGHAHRDQFSLMYVYWRNGFMPEALLPDDRCTRNSPWLQYHPHEFEVAEVGKPSLRERIRRRLHWNGYHLLRIKN